MEINKILIANRGEIALRVMRTARDMGIKTVALYSDSDLSLPHVKFADEAVYIGGSPARDSYLKMDTILNVAKKHNVDAIHPGYGFLSENSEFANLVEQAGIIFIGPKSKAIRLMGDKLASKATVADFDVPLIPGLSEAISDIPAAKKYAKEIGYPVLIKASAGGGGKGMRIVLQENDFEENMEAAMSEATSAFGNGSVFVEKYIEEPKHIEFQVLRDSHGNSVHLFERECSIQRRYQKVVEEAPSITLDEDLRNRMGEAATRVADSCDYLGAGTVEFIVDKARNFYFLEMNTRLQVEHPVTEMITGVDLVKEQIHIAEGKALPFSQKDLKIIGHAVELRVYAEDPHQNFMPDTGTLKKYRIPSGIGIRVDGGYEEGNDIPVFYDPMISKLIAYGEDREIAIKRLKRAIEEYRISGVMTSLPFGTFVLNHSDFLDGSFTTKFVEDHWDVDKLENYQQDEEMIAAFLSVYIRDSKDQDVKENISLKNTSNWKINRSR